MKIFFYTYASIIKINDNIAIKNGKIYFANFKQPSHLKSTFFYRILLFRDVRKMFRDCRKYRQITDC